MAEQTTLVVQLRSAMVSTVYLSIRELAQSCKVRPDLVTRLVTLGLLDPVGRDVSGEPWFEAGAVPLLLKILRLRYDLGINYAGIGVVLELMDRMDRMEERIRELEVLLFP
jgi:MerR family transcriptional regulator, heat shock protein HspR